MVLPVKTSQWDYEIIIEKNCIYKAHKYINLNRKVLIVTDDGVPSEYAKTLASLCKDAVIKTGPHHRT